MKNRQRLAGMCGAALALACVGLAGCEDDDGAEETESIQTVVVVTNDAGVVETNIVAAPAAPAAEAAFSDVAGRWNGIISSSDEWANIDLYLEQDGGTISGEGYLQGGGQRAHNTVAGTVSGNHLVLVLTPDTVKPKEIRVELPTLDLDGHLAANATEYEGNWTEGLLHGTFALQKALVD